MALDEDNLKLGDGDLNALASALQSGRLTIPIRRMAVGRIVGDAAAACATSFLQHWIDNGLSESQVADILDLVVQSRKYQPRVESLIDLVLTGPESAGNAMRDTAAVVHEIFAQAQRTVMLAGFAVYNGQRIFKALADRMMLVPNLSVKMFFDIHATADQSATPQQALSLFMDRFISNEWPANAPMPQIFYYSPPNTNTYEGRSCLHAKCIVVDEQLAFITSANFTAAAQERNIEIGALVRLPAIAKRLTQYFDALVADRVLVRVL